MSAEGHLPRWARALLRWLAAPGDEDDVVGDLEEAHRRRLAQRRRGMARWLTALETLEMAVALIRVRLDRHRIRGMDTVQDYKLGLRMLVKYPGLTVAGGLALAIAIGLGAGWYDVTREVLRPRLPFASADRLIEIRMRSTVGAAEETRVLHDLDVWRRDARTLVDLGAYRAVERNLAVGEAPPEPVTVAEISASAFRVTGVPPLLGRPLLDADEAPGAPPVVVLGHALWRRTFGGRAEVIGQTVRLGSTPTTIVGVMPEGFAFPVNHRLWTPLAERRGGYAPLEGPGVRVFGLLAPGVTQQDANAEVALLAERAAVASPLTHARLRPRVLAYGGESPGDRSWLEFIVTHGPILLVLLVACVNVGTLVYARTATREAEIVTRHALGAGRGRIVAQLFVEALVLATVAAGVGLLMADRLVRWGLALYYSGHLDGPPFWIEPGLSPSTVAFAALMTVAAAFLLGVVPGLTATAAPVHTQLRTLGIGGSTLRFGTFWTTAMVAQVALTVICIPAAVGITEEALRDHRIRSAYPAERYLAVSLGLGSDPPTSDPGPTGDSTVERQVLEFQRRLAAEPGVLAVTFADRLPGMAPHVRTAEIELTDGAPPTLVPGLWLQDVGPGFFEAFDVPVVSGRDFHDGDRSTDARTALVNEAFVRQYLEGRNPIGHRVRLARAGVETVEPWLQIVGVVRDVGMTPTDRGEAPYLFTPASLTRAAAVTIGMRATGSLETLATRSRIIAAELDAGFRIDEVRPLDDLVWRQDVPMFVGAGAVAAVVALGLVLSASGVFALMAVSVARRTREIGLRTALGASRLRLVATVFSHAAAVVGGGVIAGNAVILLFVAISDEAVVADVADALMLTSAVMLSAGLLACVEPARRALRIQPVDALKEA